MKKPDKMPFDMEERRRNALIKVVLFQGGKAVRAFYSSPSRDRKVLNNKMTLDALVDHYTGKYVRNAKFLPWSSAIIYDQQSAYAYGTSGKSQKELKHFKNDKGHILELSPDPRIRELERQERQYKEYLKYNEEHINDFL